MNSKSQEEAHKGYEQNTPKTLDAIFEAKPVENVPEDVWETIYATWTGLWTDSYGQWDERQPSDLYALTELLSDEREKELKAQILAWHQADIDRAVDSELQKIERLLDAPKMPNSGTMDGNLKAFIKDRRAILKEVK